LPGPSEQLAYLCLGGNLGDPRASMAAALRRFDADRRTKVTAVSAIFRTPPWGMLDQPHFLNAVAQVMTARPPRELLALCLETELLLKRVRGERFGPRVIDIDILLYGDMSVKEVGLEIPHPRMVERAFVLAPLADLAPELAVGGVLLASHLAGLDGSGIEKITEDGSWWLE
jgi:2-amino-4-hydroxy-6-hydroxymethyldihydropteridine diphosphokinase